MIKKAIPWLFASILLWLPLLVNAASHDAGFTGDVNYEQTVFNTDYADSLDAPGGEMEVALYPGDIVLGFYLDSSESIELTLLQPSNDSIDAPKYNRPINAKYEVGWRGVF